MSHPGEPAAQRDGAAANRAGGPVSTSLPVGMRQPRARTVVAVSDPYANYLVPVPPAAAGVCDVCHVIVYAGYRRCYRCAAVDRLLGAGMAADATAFISLAPAGEQFARELFTYKRDTVPQVYRRQRTVGLATVLWRWLRQHERHVAAAAGVEEFAVVTSVPSTRGRAAPHPLTTLVRDVVSGTSARYRGLLAPTRADRADADRRQPAVDLFEGTERLAGEPVLLVDDTWTSGARAQSAAAALKAAGSGPVGAVAIGRWFDAGYRDNQPWLARVREPGWSWDRCCLE